MCIYLSVRIRYVYVMVGKAASSTVTYYLQVAEFRGSKFAVQERQQPLPASPHLAPFQLDRDEFLRIMQADNFRRFTFVRNPYSRLLSCYLHRIAGTERMNPSKRVLKRAVRHNRFPRHVVCALHRPRYRHGRARHGAALGGAARHDHVSGGEIRLHRQAGDPGLRPEGARDASLARPAFDWANMEAVNKAPMRTSATEKLRQYYSDVLMQRVADRYRIDFETSVMTPTFPQPLRRPRPPSMMH